MEGAWIVGEAITGGKPSENYRAEIIPSWRFPQRLSPSIFHHVFAPKNHCFCPSLDEEQPEPKNQSKNWQVCLRLDKAIPFWSQLGTSQTAVPV